MDDEGFDDDSNGRDERDRRAMDEEDDQDFLQELDMLAQQVGREYANMRFRYESDRSILSIFERIYHVTHVDEKKKYMFQR